MGSKATVDDKADVLLITDGNADRCGSGAFIAMPLTVGLMLFMSSYEETRGLAAIMGSTPTSE
jgi:hypothetical protein